MFKILYTTDIIAFLYKHNSILETCMDVYKGYSYQLYSMVETQIFFANGFHWIQQIRLYIWYRGENHSACGSLAGLAMGAAGFPKFPANGGQHEQGWMLISWPLASLGRAKLNREDLRHGSHCWKNSSVLKASGRSGWSRQIKGSKFECLSKEVWKLNFRQYGEMKMQCSSGEAQKWRKSEERRCRCAKR